MSTTRSSRLITECVEARSTPSSGWSRTGTRCTSGRAMVRACRWCVTFELEPYLSGFYQKPLFDYASRLELCGIECVPDFVIDDYPEIVSVFGGYRVPDFYSKSVDDDDEMEEVYRTICEVAADGRSSHRNWQPRHAEFERMLSGQYSGRP